MDKQEEMFFIFGLFLAALIFLIFRKQVCGGNGSFLSASGNGGKSNGCGCGSGNGGSLSNPGISPGTSLDLENSSFQPGSPGAYYGT
jgi:hypothetical protein